MGRYRLRLRNLILFVAMLSITLALLSSLYSGYNISRETLIQNSLDTNRAYAEKLAQTTNDFLKNSLQTLEYSAKKVAPYIAGDEKRLLEETDRLKNQMNDFNSVSIVRADSRVLAVSPISAGIKDKLLTSPGGKEALKERKPLISQPYVGINGTLLVYISTPIFDEDGSYLGLIGGSIYLKEENVMYDLLGEHFYHDGSYVYVVDKKGTIIYHRDKERITDNVGHNNVVQEVTSGKSGSSEVVNSKGVAMVAGYAHISAADWGIIAQRPTEIAVAPAVDMVQSMLIKGIPFILLSVVVVYLFSRVIARPLNLLAFYAEQSRHTDYKAEIAAIKTPYYEAIQLKKAVQESLTFLHRRVDYFMNESTTDPLTKLINRRALTERMHEWVANGTPFSLILIDIDYFKRVNDTYGHTVGDDVLQFFAKEMTLLARNEDLCCRYGGEEFILLLPYTEKKDAFRVAERLRMTVENKNSPSGKPITISSGVASYPQDGNNSGEIIEVADMRLYKAKEQGRNQTVV